MSKTLVADDSMGRGVAFDVVVRQMGAVVTINSVVEVGAAVPVCLPTAMGTPEPEAIRNTGPAPGGHGEVVLVVEDDEVLRAAAARILERNGYSVVSVSGGAYAIEMLEDPSVTIDLLLTDGVMPAVSGRRVVACAAATRPSLPVIFMSGYPEDSLAPPSRLNTMVDVLEKPFTQETLLKNVSARLGARR